MFNVFLIYLVHNISSKHTFAQVKIHQESCPGSPAAKANTVGFPELRRQCGVSHFFSFTGKVRSLSSSLWSLTHLTALYLSDNSLSRIPSDIAKLHNLVYLDLSSNKIRSLPAELGNMVSLRYTDSTQCIVVYP